MAIAFVQKATGSSSAGTSVSTTLTGVTLGNTLVLVIGYNDTSGSSSALTPPTGYTAAVNAAPQVSAGNGSDGVAVFYKLNAAAGSNTVVVNSLGGGSSLYSITALLEFSGIASTSTVDKTSSGGSASAGSTTTGNTGATGALAGSGELAVAAVALLSGSGLANAGITDPPTGYTSANVTQNTSTGVGAELAYKLNATSSGETVTWNWTTDSTQKCWAASVAVFAPLIVTPPAAYLEQPNRPRPGRGPYSTGPYFRPDYTPYTKPPTTSFSYTASGGLTFAGTAAVAFVRAVVAAGGIVFAGTFAELRKITPAPSGGIVFGGTAGYSSSHGNQSFSYTMAGGLVFGGTSAEARVKTITGAGGLTFAGTAQKNLGRQAFPSGGITFAGSSAEVAKRIVAMSGGLVFAGVADYTAIIFGANKKFTSRRMYGYIRRGR